MKNLPIQQYRLAVCLASVLIPLSCAAAAETKAAAEGPPGQSVQAGTAVDAGRYLVTIAGCNDCHTVNWAETDGKVPESDWLTGVPIGWRGPWGTTYASNLRLLVNDISEDAWVAMLRARNARPPMPWMNINRMSESDARAIYRYIRSLGLHGERMPTAVGPEVTPDTPYFLMEPVGIRATRAAVADQD